MVMGSLDLELLRRLRGDVEKRQTDIQAALAAGTAVPDFAQYRYMVGQHKALNDMIAWCQKNNDELMGNAPDKKA